MKPEYKVTGIRCHIGVQVKGTVETGVSCTRTGVELFMDEKGVYIECKTPSFVPYTNIHQVLLERVVPSAKEKIKPPQVD